MKSVLFSWTVTGEPPYLKVGMRTNFVFVVMEVLEIGVELELRRD